MIVAAVLLPGRFLHPVAVHTAAGYHAAAPDGASGRRRLGGPLAVHWRGNVRGDEGSDGLGPDDKIRDRRRPGGRAQPPFVDAPQHEGKNRQCGGTVQHEAAPKNTVHRSTSKEYPTPQTVRISQSGWGVLANLARSRLMWVSTVRVSPS